MRRNVYLAVIAVLLSIITGCSPMMKAELDLIKAGVDVSRGKYDEGIAIYQNILAGSPDLVRARSGLGYAFLKADRVEESVAEFKKALELEPGDPYSILYLGVAYLKQRAYNEATETWKQYGNKESPLSKKK